jgi:hypothetical protein
LFPYPSSFTFPPYIYIYVYHEVIQCAVP